MGNLHEKPNIAPPEAKDAGAIRSYRSQCPNCKVNRIERYARLVPVSQVAAIKKKLVQKAKNGESAELTYSELVELERSER